MYLIRETTTQADMLCSPPFGPGFPPAKVQIAKKMEVWGSAASEPGNDYCVFRLIGEGGKVLEEKRLEGF